MTTNSVKVTDTTFRDAHQSLMATRLRTADMEPIAAKMDSIGFHSMEVWGGATFDTTTRFLGEDPWERLRVFKQLMPNTPLQMLLRGQSLVGYRAYADDVVDAFVEHSAEVGVDIFRVFDALNDERNLQRAAESVRNTGKHLQLTICYSVTEEGRLGGPIYNLEYFIEKARIFQKMGADSICLKDMAGLMAPYDAYNLVSALKPILDVPLQLHTHYTSGMASMTVLKAIEAGIDVVDACLAPLALRTSQPAVEPLIMTLRDTDRDTLLNTEKILEIGEYLESILPKYREHMQSPRAAVIDATVLSHQIPGGMTSNLISQLKEADALDRLPEVLEEIPRTRQQLGYPPLVTPMSQMVGSQALSNVLFGRYKMVSDQVKDYVDGLYGQPPASLDPQLVELILKDREHGKQPVFDRPADLVKPELDNAKEAIKDISTDIADVLTYALYPATGLKFLRIKYGLDPLPDEMKPKTIGQQSGPKVEPASSGPQSVQEKTQPLKSSNSRLFNVYVENKFYQVEIDPATPSLDSNGSVIPDTTAPQNKPHSPSPQSSDTTIVAPMPGIIIRYMVEVGQVVSEGDPIVILEAMKMENTLPCPLSGQVKELPLEPGVTVKRGEVLATITKK